MIVEAFIRVLGGAVSAIASLLPTFTVPFAGTLQDLAEFVGSQLGAMNGFLPIDELGEPIGFVLGVYVPFVIVFYTVRWVYSKIPVFGQ